MLEHDACVTLLALKRKMLGIVCLEKKRTLLGIVLVGTVSL